MAKSAAQCPNKAIAKAGGIAATPTAERNMRVRIKAIATELLIRHGYRGVSFGDIAVALGTTRANIHYHFGNKTALVEEVLRDYVNSTIERFVAVWTNPKTSIAEKMESTVSFNRERYLHFNRENMNGKPWSLIARLRCDSDALNPPAVATLRRFAIELSEAVTEGTRIAIRKRELSADTPIDELVVQLVSIANSAGPITQDAASFKRLEQLYTAFLHTIQAAYGRR